MAMHNGLSPMIASTPTKESRTGVLSSTAAPAHHEGKSGFAEALFAGDKPPAANAPMPRAKPAKVLSETPAMPANVGTREELKAPLSTRDSSPRPVAMNNQENSANPGSSSDTPSDNGGGHSAPAYRSAATAKVSKASQNEMAKSMAAQTADQSAGQPVDSEGSTGVKEGLPATQPLQAGWALVPPTKIRPSTQITTNEGASITQPPINGSQVLEAPAVDPIKVTPALSLLAGRVENLTPSEIPSLVAGNPFIKASLAQDDASSMLTEPKPAGDLLRDLQVSDSVMAKASQLGIDLQKSITPAALFKALGLQPKDVANELDLLKANLEGQGLTPYMVRCAALRAQAHDEPQPLVAPVKSEGSDDGSGSPQELLAGVLAVKSQVVPQPTAVKDTEQANSQPIVPQTSAIPVRPEAPQMAGLAKNLQDSLLTAGADDPRSRIEPEQLNAMPRVATQSSDPYALLGARLFDVQRLQDKDMAAGDELGEADRAGLSLEEHLMSQSFNPVDHALANLERSAQAPLLMAQPATLAQPAILAQQGGVDPLQAGLLANFGAMTAGYRDDGRMDLARAVVNQKRDALIGSARGLETFDGLTQFDENGPVESSLHNGAERAEPTRDGDAFGPVTSHRVAETGEGQGGGRESQSQQQQPQQHAAALFSTQNTPNARRLETTGGEVREHVFKQVLDRASMLVKEGGGSVRLDLGTPELGRLELAVRINHDRVDVRILAASQQARDLLTQDMSRLKAALAGQNLQLTNVEVGVGGGSAWSQSFTGGGRSGQENFAEQSEIVLGPDAVTTSRVTSSRRTLIPMTPQRTSDGRLEVLV